MCKADLKKGDIRALNLLAGADDTRVYSGKVINVKREFDPVCPDLTRVITITRSGGGCAVLPIVGTRLCSTQGQRLPRPTIGDLVTVHGVILTEVTKKREYRK